MRERATDQKKDTGPVPPKRRQDATGGTMVNILLSFLPKGKPFPGDPLGPSGPQKLPGM